MTTVDSIEALEAQMTSDIGERIGEGVRVRITPASGWAGAVTALPGVLLEELPEAQSHEFKAPEADPGVLCEAAGAAPSEEERLYSTRVFRSLCPVTGQPDYAALTIRIRGAAPDPVALLDYLVSYRRHRGFHEQCVEQIYHDLRTVFSPALLEVYAAFTRRGGIDINPFRSSCRDMPENVMREVRQ